MIVLFSNEHIKSCLYGKRAGVVVLAAPSGSGKTEMVQTLRAEMSDSVIFTGEQMYESLIEQCRNGGDASHVYKDLIDYRCVFIEDLDFYGGRPTTETVLADSLNALSQRTLVVITGVDIKSRMPYFLNRLVGCDYFTYDNQQWEKENAYA